MPEARKARTTRRARARTATPKAAKTRPLKVNRKIDVKIEITARGSRILTIERTRDNGIIKLSEGYREPMFLNLGDLEEGIKLLKQDVVVVED